MAGEPPPWAATAAPSGDPNVGLIAGPISAGREPRGSAPGLVAVVVTAVITMATAAIRLLIDGNDTALLTLGVLMPLGFLAATGVAQWQARRGPVHRFTLRATNATSTSHTFHGDLPLRTGVLVRVVPGRGDAVRAIEVLATLNGPVLRRLTGRSALPGPQAIGFALSLILLATTAAIVLGRI